jgi:hypothetical protein
MLSPGLVRQGVAAVVSVLLATACGPSQEYELTFVPGTYNDGSGRTGLAALLTLRDGDGRGPAAGANGVLMADGTIVQTFQVGSAEAAATGAYVWPDVLVSPGSRYTVRLTIPGLPEVHTTTFVVPDRAPLAPPELALSDDARQLSWTLPSGAVTFTCEASSGGLVQFHATTAGSPCDLSALPPGSYTARVLAFSSDPEAIRLSSEQRPALPKTFSVSEGRIGFVKGGDGAVALRARAVGGRFDYGAQKRGLAVWMSLTGAGGAMPTESFKIEIVGPGISGSAPMTVSYPEGVDRFIIWSYDVEARPGRYTLLATSSTRSVSASFSVPEQGPGLSSPTNVVATAFGAGGANVSWEPVAGAASYFVGVWTRRSGLYSTGRWVTGSTTRFDPGTFAMGTAYDVYVAASNVDMTLPAAVPESLALSENTYAPAGFVAN